jgi:hypothetical protein
MSKNNMGWLTALSAVIFVNVLIYLQIFPSFLFADDFYFTYLLSFYHGLAAIPGIISVSLAHMFTPIPFFITWTSHLTFGLWTPGYYVIQFLLQILNCFLVYQLAKKLINNGPAAIFASIFFACFAGNWEALGWHGAGNHIVYGAFMISTLLSWAYGYRFLPYVLLFFACLCHETAMITVPIVLFLYSSQVDRQGFWQAVKKMRYIILIAIAFILFKFIRETFFIKIIGTGMYKIGWHFFRNYLEYISLFVVPVTTSYRAAAALPTKIAALIIFLKVSLGILLAAASIYILRKNDRVFRFLLLSVLIIIIPYSFMTLPLVSRYMYEASMFFSVLTAYLLMAAMQKRGFIRQAGIVFLALMLTGNFFLSLGYQRVFFVKKELRRQILSSVKNDLPSIKKNKKLLFVDMPIRTDEIRYMLYLWYGHDDFKVMTINSDNFAGVRSKEKINKTLFDSIFVYDAQKKALLQIKG